MIYARRISMVDTSLFGFTLHNMANMSIESFCYFCLCWWIKIWIFFQIMKASKHYWYFLNCYKFGTFRSNKVIATKYSTMNLKYTDIISWKYILRRQTLIFMMKYSPQGYWVSAWIALKFIGRYRLI